MRLARPANWWKVQRSTTDFKWDHSGRIAADSTRQSLFRQPGRAGRQGLRRNPDEGGVRG